jgi:thiol:disulfide interchange protein
MKYIIIIIISAILGAFIYKNYFQGEKINVFWYDIQTASQAMQADKNTGRKPKKMLVFVYADWCGWCKKWSKNIMEDPMWPSFLTSIIIP